MHRKSINRASIITLFRNILLLNVFALNPSFSATYYMDSHNGSNSNTGLTPLQAWKNPDAIAVNVPEAGDTILFRRNGEWKGFFMSFPQNRISIGAYDTGSEVNNITPLINGAAPITEEMLFNADLDLNSNKQKKYGAKFPGWRVHSKKTGSVIASEHTRTSVGTCAQLKYNGDYDYPRIINTTPVHLAASMPMRYTFWIRVDSGSVDILIYNTVTKRYLNKNRIWVSSSIATLSLKGNDYFKWKKITVDLKNDDEIGKLSIEFRSKGDVCVDDMQFSTKWEQHSPNVYKRAMITKPELSVYGAYMGENEISAATNVASLGENSAWYWDQVSRLFYFYHDGDISALKILPLEVNRGHYKLLNLSGHNQHLNGLTFEKSFAGLQVSGDGTTIENCIVRMMSAYSIIAKSILKGGSVKHTQILDNTVYDSGNGPYLVRANYSLVKGNEIYNIGDRGKKADYESVPLQSGHHNIIEKNLIYNVEKGIDLWGSRDKGAIENEAHSNIIRFNHIHDVKYFGVLIGGVAKYISLADESLGEDCDERAPKSSCAYRGFVYDNLVHHNIIHNCGDEHDYGAGIKVNKTPLKGKNYIFNNTLYANKNNLSGESMAGGFVYVNNISLEPNDMHLNFGYGDISHGDLKSSRLSNNLYYPGKLSWKDQWLYYRGWLFNWGGKKYSSFSGFSGNGLPQDFNSDSIDPMLECSKCGSFQLKDHSPAIGAGVYKIGVLLNGSSIFLAQDIAGNLISDSQLPDIGALKFKDAEINRNTPIPDSN